MFEWAADRTPAYGLVPHYTMSADEKDGLVGVGWKNEGMGWYGVNQGLSPSSSSAPPIFGDWNHIL